MNIFAELLLWIFKKSRTFAKILCLATRYYEVYGLVEISIAFLTDGNVGRWLGFVCDLP